MAKKEYLDATYFGGLKDGLPHGSGRMEYKSGRVLKGKFAGGSVNGRFTGKKDDGTEFDGYYKDGKANGVSLEIMPDGTKLLLEYKDCIPEGYCYIIAPDGHFELGYVKDDHFSCSLDGFENGSMIADYCPVKGADTVSYYSKGDSYGVNIGTDPKGDEYGFYVSDKASYYGSFKNDLLHGHCYSVSKDAEVTSGQWKDGKYIGNETDGATPLGGDNTVRYFEYDRFDGARKCWYVCNYPDGNRIEGEFENEKFTGQCRSYFKTVHTVYVGEMTDGKITGKGTMIYPGNDKLCGEFLDSSPHGMGIRCISKNNLCIGNFDGHVASGRGIMIMPSGSFYVGELKGGKICGKGVLLEKDGDVYLGTFSLTKGFEEGVHLPKSGTFVDGTWEFGKLKKKKRL